MTQVDEIVLQNLSYFSESLPSFSSSSPSASVSPFSPFCSSQEFQVIVLEQPESQTSNRQRQQQQQQAEEEKESATRNQEQSKFMMRIRHLLSGNIEKIVFFTFVCLFFFSIGALTHKQTKHSSVLKNLTICSFMLTVFLLLAVLIGSRSSDSKTSLNFLDNTFKSRFAASVVPSTPSSSSASASSSISDSAISSRFFISLSRAFTVLQAYSDAVESSASSSNSSTYSFFELDVIVFVMKAAIVIGSIMVSLFVLIIAGTVFAAVFYCIMKCGKKIQEKRRQAAVLRAANVMRQQQAAALSDP